MAALTPKQIDYLLKNHESRSVKEMAAALGLDRKEVQRELRKLLAGEAGARSEAAAGEAKRGRKGWVHACVVAILVLSVFALYAKSLSYPFLNWDDPNYVTENRLIRSLGPAHLAEMFTKPHFNLYIPLTLVSYAVDYKLSGFDSRSYHLTNVTLHAANTCLAYILVVLVTGDALAAFAVALVFALHPVQIESVAWIAERKNVLSSLFFFLALIAYLVQAARPDPARRTIRLVLAFSLAFFLAALLSKPNVVVLPLLLFAYHVCHGGVRKKEWLGLAVFLAAALAFAMITVEISRDVGKLKYYGGSFVATARVMTVVMTKYFELLFWPARQSLLYSFPVYPSVAEAPVAFSLLGLFGAAAGLVILWFKEKKLFFWGAWYFILLLPVMNIVPFPSLMNDRYLYLPLVGFFALLFLLLRRYAGPMVLIFAVALAVPAWAFLNLKRQEVWANPEALWLETQAKTEEKSHVSFVNLGGHYLDQGEWDKAIAAFEKAISLYQEPLAYGGLGIAYFRKGDYAKAVEYYTQAIAKMPERASFYGDLALVYKKQGKWDLALRELGKAIERAPQDPLFRTNRAKVYLATGKSDEAEREFKEALRIDPAFIYALYELGLVYHGAGRTEEAKKYWDELMRLHPASREAAEARSKLGGASV
jgi:tetratricopeptide (TPR) repeat protein